MKKVFTKFACVVAVLVISVNAMAEDCTYVLNEPEEQKITIFDDYTYSKISGPCATLSFEAQKGVGIEGLRVDQYVNGSWEEAFYIKNADLGTLKYKSHSCTLDVNATQIRFYNPGGIFKKVKNVKITRATYSHAPLDDTWVAPTKELGAISDTASTSMQWSNVMPFELSLSGEGAAHFEVMIENNASECEYGIATLSAVYKHDAVGVHEAVLTISNGTYSYEIALFGTTTNVFQTPVITALPTVAPLAYGEQLTDDHLVGGEANVEGTFVWNFGEEQPELLPGEYDLPIQFVPVNQDLYLTVDTTVHAVVNKAKQSIIWEQDFSEVYVVDTLYLEAKALTELYYKITDWETASIDENQLVFFKAGTLLVDAIAKEDDFYYGDTLSVVITINPEENTSFVTEYPTATSIVYGQMLGESKLEGGAATVDGEFKWNDGDILLPVGKHYMLAIFAPAQAELYADVEFMVEVVVTKAPQTIDWTGDVPAMLELGDTVTLTATASSGLEVVYELDVEGVVEIDGEYMIAIGEGTVNVTATQDGLDEFGKANYLPADPVTYTITVIKSDVNTGLEAVEPNANTARKIIRDGLLYVIRGEHTYNALGELIR